MGLIDRLLPSRRAADFVMSNTAKLPFQPWTSTNLARIAVSDMLGMDLTVVSRADAMKIAPVARGRGLICGTLSRYPLALWELGETEELGAQVPTPSWLTSTTTPVSTISRMLWTLDDLMFNGMSLWAVNRDDNDEITDALRVDPANWSVDPDTLGVIVNGEPVADARSVILFEGPQEGLLTIANEAVKGSRNLARAWQRRVESPIPLLSLRQTDTNAQLTDDEVDAALADLETSRVLGSTTFVPFGYELDVHGEVKTDLFVEGRNAERLDWANYIGLPAAMIDGSMSTATLTYSTSEGKRSEFVDYSLSYWASPIEARLSLDDVTRHGTAVRFNLKYLTDLPQQGRSPLSED